MRDAAESVVRYYVLCNRLKNTIRTGWLHWHVKRERIESVAEHIYSTQMLAIAMVSEFGYQLDLSRVLFLLAIHEIGETVIGDITPFQLDPEQKRKREHEAVHQILAGLLSGKEIERLFLEFDAHESAEALFAYQCDKLECDLQCRLYDEEGCVNLEDAVDAGEDRLRKDPVPGRLLSSGRSWSELWLEHSRESYPYDENFRAVSDYARTNRISSFDTQAESSHSACRLTGRR